MTPADPLWLLAELMASLARAYRSYRERIAERRRLGAQPRWGIALLPTAAEPAALPDPIYARVQAALLEFGRRRGQTRTGRALAAGRSPEDLSLQWVVDGREVTVHEAGVPLFRALWSSREGGWRLFWSRTPNRWWPYSAGTHLALGSFESCVREVERDPHGCFAGAERLVSAGA